LKFQAVAEKTAKRC